MATKTSETWYSVLILKEEQNAGERFSKLKYSKRMSEEVTD